MAMKQNLKENKRIRVSKKSLKQLRKLTTFLSAWFKHYPQTAETFKIGTKITGFIGEALVFQELNKRLKPEAIWKGGTHKGYDIYIGRRDKPMEVSVKTTIDAFRPEGIRKPKPPEYQWSNSWNSAKMNAPDLFFAFVDLKNLKNKPDIFVVPSHIVHKYYYKKDSIGRDRKRARNWPWARYHIEIKQLNKYKNAWEILES